MEGQRFLASVSVLMEARVRAESCQSVRGRSHQCKIDENEGVSGGLQGRWLGVLWGIRLRWEGSTESSAEMCKRFLSLQNSMSRVIQVMSR